MSNEHLFNEDWQPSQQEIVERIYEAFQNVYGKFPMGLCGQIATALQKELDGEIVAGYLVFKTFKREHWWLNVNGAIIDPMSDALNSTDPHEHQEVHRDITKKYW